LAAPKNSESVKYRTTLCGLWFVPVIELLGQVNKDVSCDEDYNESFME